MVLVSLRLGGLALLFWTHPVLATILLVPLFFVGMNNTPRGGLIFVRNDMARCAIEFFGTVGAAIGFWKFPYFHPVIGQFLAIVTGLCLLLTLVVLAQLKAIQARQKEQAGQEDE